MKINTEDVTPQQFPQQPRSVSWGITLALILWGLASVPPITAQRNTPRTPFQTPNGEIMWPGWQPEEKVTVAYPQLPKVRSVLANGCGVIRLSHSTAWPASPQTVFQIGERTFALNILPPGPPPKCEKGMNATVELFRNPRRYNMDAYIGGFAPQAKVEVAYMNLPQTRSLSANACGLLVIRSTTTFPNNSIIVNGTPINRPSLAQRPAPICQQGKLFYPG
ncbi:hypothetical protein [Synechococcus sp. PCC 6312]|uniref:hypothetical protein n=1 Tax=Synechococcus sp. (strain ATCC 27167 / PCC 6312) TaxID=195253 RepID=UPI0002F293CE|nr:hypothetical protein [Synechococcus sp. PCC 6312]